MVVTDNDENESQRLPLDQRSGAGVRMSRNSYLGAQPQSSQLLGARIQGSAHSTTLSIWGLHSAQLQSSQLHCTQDGSAQLYGSSLRQDTLKTAILETAHTLHNARVHMHNPLNCYICSAQLSCTDTQTHKHRHTQLK